MYTIPYIKPSRSERHTIYTDALNEIKYYIDRSTVCFGLCYFIRQVTRDNFSDPYYHLEDYPEIWECRPPRFRKAYDYFFSTDDEGWLNRLLILHRAIELTKS